MIPKVTPEVMTQGGDANYVAQKTQELQAINQELRKKLAEDFQNAINKGAAIGPLVTKRLEEIFTRTEADILEMTNESADKLSKSCLAAPLSPPPAEIKSTSPLLASVFDDLWKDVNQSIEEAIKKAKCAGVDLKVDAGRELLLAIENTKNAFANSMNLSTEKANKVISDHLVEITKMVQDIKLEDQETLRKLGPRTQQLMNTLPLANWEPKVNSMTPKLVVIDSTVSTILITIEGNFKCAATKGFEPSLTLAEHTFKPIKSTTQTLEFQVPAAVAFANASPFMRTYTPGTLQVPYEAGWIWSDIKTSQYKGWLAALPLNAGNIRVYYAINGKDEREEMIDLKWGDSKVFELKPGESISKVITTCDGKLNEYTATNYDNPYLNFEVKDGNLHVSTKKP